jgi:hypothetical protein
MKRIFGLFVFLMFVLAACSTEPKKSEALTVAEEYQQAFAEKDADRVSALSCADWEEQALLEMDSFQAVTVTLQGLTCQETGKDGDAVLVRCDGKLMTTYGEEKREFDLGNRTFRLVQQGGNWLVCGAQ